MAKNNSKENNKKVLFAVIIVLLVAFAIYAFNSFYVTPRLAPPPKCGDSSEPVSVSGKCSGFEKKAPRTLYTTERMLCSNYASEVDKCRSAAKGAFISDVEYCGFVAGEACIRKLDAEVEKFKCPPPSSVPVCPGYPDPCKREDLSTGCSSKLSLISFLTNWFKDGSSWGLYQKNLDKQ